MGMHVCAVLEAKGQLGGLPGLSSTSTDRLVHSLIKLVGQKMNSGGTPVSSTLG